MFICMKKVIFLFAFAVILFSPLATRAECAKDADCGAKMFCCSGACQAAKCEAPAKDSYGFGSGSKLDTVAGNFKPSTPQPLEQRVASIIAIALSFLGVIFLILMIWAGFGWMTAAGDEEKITKSKETIRSAIIGLIIVIAAYALSVFIIERIWGAV